MKFSKSLLLGFLAACLVSNAVAYEVNTHARLSTESFSASTLQLYPNKLSGLGIETSSRFPNSKGLSRSVVQLFQDGAGFEDDFPRSLNHFFNPINDQALSVSGFAAGNTSPDWALEDKGQIVGGVALGGQEFSYRDGRSYFYLGLTSPAASDRDKHLGLLFQTMGQVIHHVQDMAQPQHVRNDQHLELASGVVSGICAASIPLCSAYAALRSPSAYETHTKNSGKLVFTGYDAVYSQRDTLTFNAPRKFWHTENQLPFLGKGLAEFTNQNFVSVGTNFDKSGIFGMPTQGNKIEIDIKLLITDTPLEGKLTFWGSTVKDNYTKEVINNPFASTESLFDVDLKKKGKTPVFSLNSFNYDVANALLIPRAVGYSAGLINYFFRGDIALEKSAADGFVIRNDTSEDMSGLFQLFYDDANDVRRAVPITGQPWNLAIAKNAVSTPVNFSAPTNPPPKKKGEYMLVFNGTMGLEEPSNGSVGAVTGAMVKLVSTAARFSEWRFSVAEHRPDGVMFPVCAGSLTAAISKYNSVKTNPLIDLFAYPQNFDFQVANVFAGSGVAPYCEGTEAVTTIEGDATGIGNSIALAVRRFFDSQGKVTGENGAIVRFYQVASCPSGYRLAVPENEQVSVTNVAVLYPKFSCEP